MHVYLENKVDFDTACAKFTNSKFKLVTTNAGSTVYQGKTYTLGAVYQENLTKTEKTKLILKVICLSIVTLGFIWLNKSLRNEFLHLNSNRRITWIFKHNEITKPNPQPTPPDGTGANPLAGTENKPNDATKADADNLKESTSVEDAHKPEEATGVDAALKTNEEENGNGEPAGAPTSTAVDTALKTDDVAKSLTQPKAAETEPVTTALPQEQVPVTGPASKSSTVLTYEEFAKKFKLGSATTEKLHPDTLDISQVMMTDVKSGFKKLLNADRAIFKGLNDFGPMIEQTAPQLRDRLNNGGRIFLVGSGSSGRVSIDAAAKFTSAYPQYGKQVYGVVAGGDRSMVRAKEGFEDSELDGEKALAHFEPLNANDSVIVISASGSSSFNAGCATRAAEQLANVYYFYNSLVVPERTSKLFSLKNPVSPWCIDIGPQAIGGSTRLQAATLAMVGLGALLSHVGTGSSSLTTLEANFENAFKQIQTKFPEMAAIVNDETAILSAPGSNFRTTVDQGMKGNITALADVKTLRTVFVDFTELPPTYNVDPMRTAAEKGQKRAPFQTYLQTNSTTASAWETLLGRAPLTKADLDETKEYLLSSQAPGFDTFSERVYSEGNFLLGLFELKGTTTSLPPKTMQIFQRHKEKGGKNAAILVTDEAVPKNQIEFMKTLFDTVIVVDNLGNDPMNLTHTLLIKLMLNLISNATMAKMGKLYGNRMIDLRAANGKLIDRCMRLIREIYEEITHEHLDDKELYDLVIQIQAEKSAKKEQGDYTPSVVKIGFTMLLNNCSFDQAVLLLKKHNESLDLMVTPDIKAAIQKKNNESMINIMST